MRRRRRLWREAGVERSGPHVVFRSTWSDRQVSLSPAGIERLERRPAVSGPRRGRETRAELAGHRRLPGSRDPGYLPLRGIAFSRNGEELAVLLTQNDSPNGVRIASFDLGFGDVVVDHIIKQPLETFGLSSEARGLQWLADDSGWFVSEQWAVDWASGRVIAEPMGVIGGLSAFRRVLIDGSFVVHVSKKRGSTRTLMSRPLIAAPAP